MSIHENEISLETAKLLELELNTDANAREQLKERINYLILHDFNKLVAILYRMDVDEEKLKYNLKTKFDSDAAEIICTLMLERQALKLKIREEFRNKP